MFSVEADQLRRKPALTPFSRTRYYPNSARNWPAIYTLRLSAAIDPVGERARSPPAGPRQASERIKAPLERPVIEVQHITKRYGGVTAVDDVSFRVERGEILGFLGPNGAGKTTTMRILTGYMPPTDGHAVGAGYELMNDHSEGTRRTGYLPETPPHYPGNRV